MICPAPDFANTPVAEGRPTFGYTPLERAVAPAVSVITPFYNTGEVFLETARCVMGQSLQQWQWIIVNDGSDRPESLQILDSFRTRDPRIRVIDSDRNRGPAAARNTGLQRIDSPLVFFLDSDDLIEPTALEKLAWCLESHPEAGFCKGYTLWFGAEATVSSHGFKPGPAFLRWNMATISAMVRRDLAVEAGGFDEALTDGLEDWDFWLRCAARGKWGQTVDEPLDWYRRRADHSERWGAWNERGERDMRRELRRRYPSLYSGGFPRVASTPQQPYAGVPDSIPFENKLAKEGRRILLALPWMAMGGADRINLDLIHQLIAHEWEVTVVTTLPDNYAWHREFARLTPDIFVLHRFLRPVDYPRFLHYMVQSRQTDVVLVSNSELTYRFLPYLRARCPETAFVDLCHMEEEAWNNGGHPRQAVAYQSMLDLNIVTSQHLKDWMVGRGAQADQIEVCTSNVDTTAFAPDASLRQAVRAELGIAPDIPVILYAGRLCAQKQPRIFADVMRQLVHEGARFVCLVAGDGPDRAWLSSFLRRHHLKREVRMLGAVSSQRMRGLLAASDLFFLPSEMEGISVAIYEAMAVGVVPVGADVGGQRELVTPDCGILIQRGEGEVAAYAEALERLLRSAELRSRLGHASRARVCSQFTIEQLGERTVALLDQALQTHSGQAVQVDLRLGREHAVQAIEHQRVLSASDGLWKRSAVEAAGRRLGGWLGSCSQRFEAVQWKMLEALRPLRRAKDAVWIAGHRVKTQIRRGFLQRPK